ncbi:hypothetical protein BHE74_00040733 [Ensete ventricosum]|nr:hypothetical protein BHE74_00040733 [Ensete ventricosum]
MASSPSFPFTDFLLVVVVNRRKPSTTTMASLRAMAILAILACMLLMRSASADVVAVGADGLTIKSTDFHRQATATPADVSASNHDAEVDEDGTDMLHGFDQELIVLGH